MKKFFQDITFELALFLTGAALVGIGLLGIHQSGARGYIGDLSFEMAVTGLTLVWLSVLFYACALFAKYALKSATRVK